jgi:hypothetical protein
MPPARGRDPPVGPPPRPALDDGTEHQAGDPGTQLDAQLMIDGHERQHGQAGGHLSGGRGAGRRSAMHRTDRHGPSLDRGGDGERCDTAGAVVEHCLYRNAIGLMTHQLLTAKSQLLLPP